MFNSKVLEELERLGFDSDIESFKSYIEKLQDSHALGNSLVDDSVYDHYIRILKEIEPNCELLNRNWEIEDEQLDGNDELLDKYGMCSIRTVTDFDELGSFADTIENIGEVDLVAMLKLNGHAGRVVYRDGELVSASTRGRYKKGRDVTRHAKLILPNYVEEWDGYGLVELRGEFVVSISTFEKHLQGKLKTPLSSVTSLIRESASDEEIKLMDMVMYRVLTEEEIFESLSEELRELKRLGFKIPLNGVMREVDIDSLEDTLDEVLENFEGAMDKGMIEYATDGIVVLIDDNEEFYGAEMEGNSRTSNIALKMGRHWNSNVYSSIIEDIEFKCGKKYIVPKAIIKPVVTNNGSEVTNVPLYNVGVMDRYRYIPGETIYFRYGGEMGVTLCDRAGQSVKIQ